MITTISLENFKGTTKKIELGQLNIFRGSSGSGKSTWLEAVRVAILGHDPGYGKLLAETMSFASGNSMSVRVVHNDISIMRVFTNMNGKAKQTIAINGKSMIAKVAEPELAKAFGRFPMMLNPDEFFDMSDDKKISFLFGLSDTETNSEILRRECILLTLSNYTDAVDFILEYEFEKADPLKSLFETDAFSRLIHLAIDKVAEKNAPAGRALTKIFSELLYPKSVMLNGQETLSMYAETMRTEINATRRAKQDAEAANRKLIEEKAEKMKLVSYNEEENQKEISRLREVASDLEKDLHSRDKLKDAKARLVSGIEIHAVSIGKNRQHVEDLKAMLLSEEQVKESNGLIGALDKNNKVLSGKYEKALTQHEELNDKFSLINTRQPTPSCSVCGNEVKCEKCKPMSVAQKKKATIERKDLQEKCKELEDYISSISSAQKENTLDMEKLSLVLNTHESNLSKYHIAAQHLKDLEGLIKEETKNLDNLEEPGANTDILQVNLRATKASLVERLVAEKNHQWLRTLSGTIASSNETIYNSEAQLSAFSVVEKSVKAVRNELTRSATASVEKICNGLLHKVREGFHLTYEIEDGRFDVRCVNVNGNTVPFKTLSGGEKVLYLSAQLLSLMAIVDPNLKILEVEMGELSGDLVPPFMNALKFMTEDTSVQIVLSSCHTDFEVEDTEAWTVHQMGE